MKMNRSVIKAAMLERMDELGMNVATLARKAGLSYDTPRDFLVRDKSGMPGADKLVAMLEALDLQHLLVGGKTSGSRNGLRAMREQRGYSIEELAERLPRISAKTIQKLEAGGTLSYEWKVKLANALECRVDDLDAPSGISESKTLSGLEDTSRAWKPAPAGKKKGSRPSFTDAQGWTAQYEELLPGVPHQFLGKICVVTLDDHRTLIRRVQPGETPGRYMLEGIHPGSRVIKNALVLSSAIALMLEQA